MRINVHKFTNMRINFHEYLLPIAQMNILTKVWILQKKGIILIR